MSQKLKYYYDLMSQPSRALYIFLKITNIPFEAVPVALRKGEHLSETFKNDVNRFGKVPCIKQGDFKLSESVAILRYLARQNKINDHWYPAESVARACVDEYIEWQHLNTRIHCALYFRVKWLGPILTGVTPAPEKIAKYRKSMEEALDVIENVWLKHNNRFIVGDQISIADLLAACEIEQPRMAGYNPCVNRPKMEAWLARVKAATNPYYDEAHMILNKVAAASESASAKL